MIAFTMLAVLLVALPLALAPGLHFFDITPKVVLLLIGAPAAWLFLAIEGRWPQVRGRQASFFWLLAGLAVAGILATITARDRIISVAGSEWRRMGLPAWLACLALSAAIPVAIGADPRRKAALAACLALAAFTSSVYVLAQYAGWDPWISPALYRIGEGEWQIVRPPGTLGHASYFAAFALLGMFIAAGFAVSARSASSRAFWWIAAIIPAIAVVISGSRGALLGAVAGAAVVFWRAPQRKKVLVVLLTAVAAGALFVASPAGQPVRSRIRWFVEDPAGGARLPLWRDSLRFVLREPFLGVGPDGFQLAFLQRQSLQLAQNAPDRYAESPHNVFLDYATAAGIPAALLFFALLFVAGRRLSPDAGLLAALVAFIVAAQFISDIIPTRVALLSLLALAVPMQSATPSKVSRIAVAMIAAITLVAAVWLSVRLVRADRAMWKANEALARRDLAVSSEWAAASHRAFPWTGAFAFTYSQAVAQLFSPATRSVQNTLVSAVAEQWAREALPHSQKPHLVHVHLASLYVVQGRRQEAEQALRAAITEAPAWYRPRWLLAILLADSGRNREAAEQARTALDRGAERHPEIAASCRTLARLPIYEGIDSGRP